MNDASASTAREDESSMTKRRPGAAWVWFAGASVALGAACEDTSSGAADTGAETATAADSAVDSAGDGGDDTTSPPDTDVATQTEVVAEVETLQEVGPDETGETGETVTPPPITLDGPCKPAERYGRFAVEAQRQWAIVTGAVANGIVPNTLMTEAVRDGACKLMQKMNPNCDPPCQPGQACGLDSVCVPYPLNYDVGTVTITGLVGPVVMNARAPALDYSNTSLANPPFEPGAEIRLSNGDGTPALALGGLGFSPIAPLDDTWNLVRGQAITVRWDTPAPGDEPVRTRVELQILIDQHGSSPMFLTCDFADAGRAIVSATIVDALLDAGISGFPSGKLTRATTDSASLEAGGCVEFRVASPRTLAVRVAGHVPCKKPADCPGGQTCNLAKETCE